MKKIKKGFTLIELIIVIAIIGMILVGVYTIFITGLKLFNDADIKTTLQMESDEIQEEITKKCIEGESIITCSNNKIQVISYEDESKKEKIRTRIESEGKNLNIYVDEWNGSEFLEDDVPKTISKNLDEDKEEPVKIETHKNEGELKSFTLNANLHKKQGFSDVKYPVSVTVTLRNSKGNIY